MIIMVTSAKHKTLMEGIVRRVKVMMMNWGLGEGCSSIYAVLIASCEPLSAEEISARTSYAYSSTINYLNTLIRMGLVARFRGIRKNRYLASVNFVELIKAERERVMGYLNQLRDDLEGIKDLEHLSEKVEHAIDYLRRVENAENEAREDNE
ncbi:MAG: helix-turn-helix domain-containing protein [archaeon]|nr:helix-turn-helix domain-containing protein [archaeon]